MLAAWDLFRNFYIAMYAGQATSPVAWDFIFRMSTRKSHTINIDCAFTTILTASYFLTEMVASLVSTLTWFFAAIDLMHRL